MSARKTACVPLCRKPSLKVGSRLVPVKRHRGEPGHTRDMLLVPVLYQYRLDCDHDARETVNTQGPRFYLFSDPRVAIRGQGDVTNHVIEVFEIKQSFIAVHSTHLCHNPVK